MATVYQNRNLIAALPSLGLVMFLLIGGVREVRSLKPKYDEPVKLEIIDMSEVPSPPEPVKPPPVKSEPPPRPQPPAAPVRPAVQPPTPAPSIPQTLQPSPSQTATPSPAVEATPAPAKTSEAPTSAPAPATPAAPKTNVEAEFVARVKAYLNSVKRYPTGREASLARPEGSVKIWFILRRDGSLVEMGIEASSNSTLLDEAARKSVSRGTFPVFPEQFRPGEQQHKFVVDLQFKPASN